MLRFCIPEQQERTLLSELWKAGVEPTAPREDDRWDCWLEERAELEDALLRETLGTGDDPFVFHSS